MITNIEKLRTLARKKENIENVLVDLKSLYYKTGEITVEIESSDYDMKTDGEILIEFNKPLFVEYLINELKMINEELIKTSDIINKILLNENK